MIRRLLILGEPAPLQGLQSEGDVLFVRGLPAATAPAGTFDAVIVAVTETAPTDLKSVRDAVRGVQVAVLPDPSPLARSRAWRLGADVVLDNAPDLAAVLAAIAELLPPATPERVELADGFVLLEARRVIRGDRTEHLTPREAALLAWMAARPNQIVTTRELLVEVWGYKPNLQTRAVHNTVARLRQKLEIDPRAPSHLRTEFGVGFLLVPASSSPAPASPPSQVEAPPMSDGTRPPAPPLGRFLGRDDQLDALRQLVQERRLVTVVGTGGAGKTRLVLELCADWPGDLRFADLTRASSEAAFAGVVADGLGVELGSDGSLDTLVRRAQSLDNLLLILDNAEHVVGPAAELAERLMRGQGPRVIVTSRVPLRLRSEWLFPLAGLEGIDAAVELFLERARAFRPDLTLDAEDRQTLSAALQTLECLPLAIELAAARVRIFDVASVCERLRASLDFLRARTREPDARHGTLRATIDGSWQLLQPAEQRALIGLGVFAGAFGLEAAAQVLEEDESDVEDVLEGLVDSSLLTTAQAPGWRLLQPVQQFTRSLEGDAAERRRRAGRAHARWFARWGRDAGAAKLDLHGGDGRRVLSRELPDVERAISSALETDERAHLPALLAAAGAIRGRSGPVAPFAAALQEARGRLEGVERAHTLAFLGLEGLSIQLGLSAEDLRADFEAAEAAGAEQSATLILLHRANEARTRRTWEEAGPLFTAVVARASGGVLPECEVKATISLAHWSSIVGSVDEAERLTRLALKVADEHAATRLQSGALSMLALARWRGGAPEEAIELLKRAQALAQRTNDRPNLGVNANNATVINLYIDRVEDAARSAQEALSQLREVGNLRYEARALKNFGLVHLAAGETAEAEKRLWQALAAADEAAVNNVAVRVREELALLAARDRPGLSRRLLAEARAMLPEGALQHRVQELDSVELECRLRRGDPAAEEPMRQLITEALAEGRWSIAVRGQIDLADALRRRGDLADARHIHREARAVADEHARRMTRTERRMLEELAAQLDEADPTPRA